VGTIVVVGSLVICNSFVGSPVGESVSCCPKIGSVGPAVASIVVVGALVICWDGNVDSGTANSFVGTPVGESVSCCPVMGSVGNAVGAIAVGNAGSSMFAISVGVLVVGNLVNVDDIGVLGGEGGLKEGDEAGDEPS
jgi:hypothetical protein